MYENSVDPDQTSRQVKGTKSNEVDLVPLACQDADLIWIYRIFKKLEDRLQIFEKCMSTVSL